MIRTRFAPSPTGNPHVGNMRTALFAYLFAKKNKGKFVLRIEDTDRERFVESALDTILLSLRWLGIVPDEGPMPIGGDYGPYLQSQRLEQYQKYAGQLLAEGHAYYCFCTEDRLEELRKIQTAGKQPTRYDRHCLQLTDHERQQQLTAKTAYVIRLKVADNEKLSWNDLVCGAIEFSSNEIDDQVLLKSDGFPSYHLAHIVDDHLMEITHVIRSVEWLSSTPKHILLYRFLGWEAPQFAHVPLVLGSSKAKLSKRDGAVGVLDFKRQGYLPEALVNFMAFLGWNPKTECEIFSLQELINEFDLDKINKSGAVFNIDKLNWYNGIYIRQKPLKELTELCLPFLLELGLIIENKGKFFFNDGRMCDRSYLEAVVALSRERLKTLLEIGECAEYFFRSDLKYDLKMFPWKKMNAQETREHLLVLEQFLIGYSGAWNKDRLEEGVKSLIADNGLSTGGVLWPWRVSLSGREASPSPFELTTVFGREETLRRLHEAIKLLSASE